jgi:hypothetical protein
MLDRRLILLLLSRLERISADSIWAHRASGVRGALLRLEAQFDAPQRPQSPALQRLVDQGFEILERAAQEKI